jgi:hypothetical protein
MSRTAIGSLPGNTPSFWFRVTSAVRAYIRPRTMSLVLAKTLHMLVMAHNGALVKCYSVRFSSFPCGCSPQNGVGDCLGRSDVGLSELEGITFGRKGRAIAGLPNIEGQDSEALPPQAMRGREAPPDETGYLRFRTSPPARPIAPVRRTIRLEGSGTRTQICCIW